MGRGQRGCAEAQLSRGPREEGSLGLGVEGGQRKGGVEAVTEQARWRSKHGWLARGLVKEFGLDT